ncbi:helix-turn-helix transcriptional regulator [Moorella naiadis]|uniref:helix-turn-helix transcriptional regulator n=1 Tax=Moorella naiadis (nom. illeg.) TaxID=3093670 RepID=UPI003D9C8003
MRIQLIKARKQALFTQAEIANRLGIARAAYAHYERGSRTPSIDIALKIANILGCKVEDIFLSNNVSDSHHGYNGTEG